MIKKQNPLTTTLGGVITILIIGLTLIIIMFKSQSIPPKKIVLMGEWIEI